MAKFEIRSPDKLAGFNFHRSDYQLNWSALCFVIGLLVKLVRLPDLLADSKLNCSDLLKMALLSGYKALGD